MKEYQKISNFHMLLGQEYGPLEIIFSYCELNDLESSLIFVCKDFYNTLPKCFIHIKNIQSYFYEAIRMNKFKIVDLLLKDKRVNIDRKSFEMSSRLGHLEIIKLLMKNTSSDDTRVYKWISYFLLLLYK